METKQIHKSMVAIMRSVEHIGKDKKNQQQGFNYRGIDDLYNALHSAFAANGVIIVPEILDIQREERTSSKGGLLLWTIQKIKFKFVAEDGSFIEAILIGEAMDSADKGTNKANSVALKYALMQMFLIPTEELKNQDPDGSMPDPKSTYEVEKDECMRLIGLSKTVEDLSQLKEMYPDLFKKDADVKKAGTDKYNKLKQ
ncbi:ERF family protein [Chitinophaga sp. YIM B06452]|uniref:ERF family protein n=1 Tax=Chitinophaga sp. YIM B06452 TaxID=3082158 RepID=UPI0031FE9A3E